MNPGWRVLDFTKFEGNLEYRRGHVAVFKQAVGRWQEVPLAQVAVILIGLKIKITSGLMAQIAAYDIALIVCDWKSVPVAAISPWSDHTRVGARQRAQAAMAKPRRKNAWGRIVRAKVNGQATTLRLLNRKMAGRLSEIANAVRSGDPDNREAVAARQYWGALVDSPDFCRRPGEGDGPMNACFDYAYTVLRGHGIRAVMSAGLSGTLSVYHRGRGNPFSLVDDMIEPFRPAIDFYVVSALGGRWDITEKRVKQVLVDASTQQFSDEGFNIVTALTKFAQDFGRYAEGDIDKLDVPIWRGDVGACSGN